LSGMEKNLNNKIKTAVQSVKDENKTLLNEEQNETKVVNKTVARTSFPS